MQTYRTIQAVRFLLAGMLLAAGCSSPPKGISGGRVDIARTTSAERDSAKVLPAALVEFSDQVAQRVVQDLAGIPEISQAGRPVTVIVGDIMNKTGIVSTNEFELVRSRIRNSLLQSEYARDQLEFVENRARMDSIRRREAVRPSEQGAIDPETTFALNGDFYRIGRGSDNQYYMEFQLVHFKTNKIVFSDRYDIKQRQG